MHNFALLGNPVSHSLSPEIHNFLFSEFGIDGGYTKVLVENQNALLANIKEFSGVNITAPYKREAYCLCDEVVDVDCGVVNTIIYSDGKLRGYNTDCIGFYECLRGYDIESVLIIGGGGSARAIYSVLAKNGFVIDVLSRSMPSDFFGESRFELLDFEYANKQYDLIINTTPSGMPIDRLLADSLFSKASLVIDISYGRHSEFLEIAKSCGIDTQNGIEMLKNQAFFAFCIFCREIFGLQLEFDMVKNTFKNFNKTLKG